jgi:hypothetical protein
MFKLILFRSNTSSKWLLVSANYVFSEFVKKSGQKTSFFKIVLWYWHIIWADDVWWQRFGYGSACCCCIGISCKLTS